MAKPEWGTKRTCESCGERFFDLGRNPVVCPYCRAIRQVENAAALRRAASANAEAAAANAKAAAHAKAAAKARAAAITKAAVQAKALAVASMAASGGGPDEVADHIDGAKADDDLIEDASDLGEDDDDIAEAMEHVVDDVVVDGN